MLKRDIFTGEYVETEADLENAGRVIIARESLPYGDNTVMGKHIAPNYERECVGMSIKPEEATPERIAEYNEGARKHNTGVYYDSHGRCMTTTRGSQNRELKRRNMRNNDPGFGDYAGR